MSLFTPQKKVVVIVNGISSGVLLTNEIKDNFDLIHIESDIRINAFAASGFNQKSFFALYQWNLDKKEDIISELRKMNPIAVIPGSESGVELSEKLAYWLDIDGNDPKTTHLRRDKFEMNEAVRLSGLRVTPQFVSQSPGEIRNWFEKNLLVKAVVKPLASAGSDDVYVCKTSEETEIAAKIIDGKMDNFVHLDNHKALIQKFIEGTEYVINSVTLGDVSKITDVWRVTKKQVQGRNLYDFDDLCDEKATDTIDCINYTREILPILGIKKGAGHTEVIMSYDGPTLLEVGARASGAANPKAIRLVTGEDQIRMMIHAYTNPSNFDRSPNIYHLKKPLRCIHAVSSGKKVFSHDNYLNFLKSIPGFIDVVFKIKDNTLLPETVDVATCPAAFFITGNTQEDIERSYSLYRLWESRNF